MSELHRRPTWARHLDRPVRLLFDTLGRLLQRPTEARLASLAHRTGAPPRRDELQAGRRALEAGALGEALHHFGRRLQRVPQDPWAWHGKGDAFQLMGEHDAALQAYRSAAGLQPDQALHLGGQANALAALGREDEAAEVWARALHLDPEVRWMRPRAHVPG